ncbi:hypothetical protein QUF61_05245 [Candidatus Venteria ishoeyi]|uniref:hypothetical protein n=1 Tax=Candidatus Venteria ishoeyi TaxID=1899563 RepID=UPI0025A65E18|nr:hypothetical protein [Candidatus Venteria ishoeyi]MDM8545876.1 hypothetical protein [Candidatus Venteria ishoeyi]
MNIKNSIIIILFCFPASVLASEVFKVSPELIQQMFGLQDKNQHVAKRPFNLSELEQLLQTPEMHQQDAEELTRRYLAICYPAGEVALQKLLDSELSLVVKKTLLGASPAQVRFGGSVSLIALLQQNDTELLTAIANAPGLRLSMDVPVKEILAFNSSNYQANIFYGTYVPMRDIQQKEYTLSTARAKNHLLAAFLDQNKNQRLNYFFTARHCKQSRCLSPNQGVSFAAFEFADFSAYGVKADDQLVAACFYEGLYRRDYRDKTEIELKFTNCKLTQVNGAPPQTTPLLETLKRVSP